MLTSTHAYIDDKSVELVDDSRNDGWRLDVRGNNDEGIGEPHGDQGSPPGEYREMEEVDGVGNEPEEEEPSDPEMDEPGEEGCHRYGGFEGEEY